MPGSFEATVCSTRPKHFYRIGDEAFAAPSILPISRAHTLNRDMEQSSDFVELLGLVGLKQVELHSTTPDDVDLEAGRIIAHWQKPKQSSAVPIFPQLRLLDQCNPLLVKFTEPGKLPERPEGMRILMALEVKFFSRGALPLKSEAPTVQVDARLRSATTYNKCRGPPQFYGHLQLKPLKESDRLKKGSYMAVKISANQIQNIQQIEAVVTGPDDANRLFIIDGQFDAGVSAFSQGSFVTQKEFFTVLVGPVFERKQFLRANATASLTKTFLGTSPSVGPPAQSGWNILSVDADWDDESGQVELRIEAEVICSGPNQSATINGFAFHVTILAAVAAA